MNKFIISAILYFIFIFNINAAINAVVDKNNIQNGETITLTIDMTDVDSDPDLSVLNNDFEIVGSSRSSQTSIVNFKSTTSSSLILQLNPKKTGKLIIPSISVGNNKTQPITINVDQSSANNNPNNSARTNENSSDIYFEASLDSHKTYVNVPVKLKLKVLIGTQVGNLTIMPSTQADISIDKFGENKQYTAIINGRNYNILEVQYLVTPKNTGLIKIKPLQLSGVKQTIDNDTFGFFSIPNYKQFKLSSKELSLNVNAVPSSLSSNIILASNVKVHDEWSIKDLNVKIGEPITRIVTVETKGASSSSIPNISLNYPHNFNAYNDKPQIVDNKSNEIMGTKIFKFVYIPQTSGDVIFPEDTLQWLNISNGKVQTISLKSRKFRVSQSASSIIQQINSKNAIIGQHNEYNKFSNTTFLFIILWLLTLILLIILLLKRRFKFNSTKKLKIKSPKQVINSSLTEIKHAAQAKDIKLLNSALIQWANSYFNKKINIIDEINKYIINEELSKIINEINEDIYYSKTFDNYERLLQILNELCANKNPKLDKEFLDGFYPK